MTAPVKYTTVVAMTLLPVLVGACAAPDASETGVALPAFEADTEDEAGRMDSSRNRDNRSCLLSTAVVHRTLGCPTSCGSTGWGRKMKVKQCPYLPEA